ncbi:MAG TPA: PLP-dependent aminotransferase family protein [Pyrinomonadaceae bacterium]|nr:PLP-dependent aminotransferase family protein [Pyrinomonadaceae bacterium]
MTLSVKPQQTELASWARGLKQSALQQMLVATARPGITSFALGMPAVELFPTAALASAAERVLSVNAGALQYSPPLQSLKQHVRELMKLRGINCREEQIFLTAGAQQGMSLLSRLLLEPGGSVITEELIYSGFQQVLQPFQPQVLTVSTDPETGMDVEAVEQYLSSGVRPSFIYSITDGHNPLSVSLHPSKRARLVDLAEQYRVPIIEDDVYGFLCYENPLLPLRASSERWVFYVGSFSKILAPALRVGWLVVPEELILPLSVIKESTDIDAAPLSQRIVNTYLDTGQLPAQIDMLRTQYRLRRDTMLRTLAENFPDTTRWTKPDCGFFVWVELPQGVDADELFRRALEDESVAFIPGHAFSVNNKRSSTPSIRLNFSHPTTARIEEGIPRLARVLKSVI